MGATRYLRQPFTYWLWFFIICIALSGGVYFWWARGLRPVHTFVLDHTITRVTMSPDNQYIVATGKRTRTGPQRVFIWQTVTHQLLASFPQDESVTHIAVSPDTTLLAIATERGRLTVWSPITQEVVYTVRAADATFLSRTDLPYPSHAEPCRKIQSITFHPQGSYLAVGCLDGVVVLVQPDTGALLASAQGHRYASIFDGGQRKSNAEVFDLMFSPDGRFLATGGGDGVVELWQVEHDTLVATHTLVLSDTPVSQVAWKSNHRIIVSKQHGREIDIWSLDEEITGRHIYLEYPRVPSQIHAIDTVNDRVAIAHMSDGTGIPVGTTATIYLYQLPSLQQRTILRGHHGTVYSAAFSRDGEWLVSSGDDRTVRLWRLAP